MSTLCALVLGACRGEGCCTALLEARVIGASPSRTPRECFDERRSGQSPGVDSGFALHEALSPDLIAAQRAVGRGFALRVIRMAVKADCRTVTLYERLPAIVFATASGSAAAPNAVTRRLHAQ